VTGGSATITYTFSTGCNTAFPITVGPQPSPVSGVTVACIGATIMLSDTTAGGLWTSSNITIISVDPISGILTGGLATGTSTISYTLGSGCAATAVVTVNIGPLPVIGTLTLCIGTTTGLSDAIGGGSWSSSNSGIATVDTSGYVYGRSAGTATISYVLGSCAVMTIVTMIHCLL